MLHIRDDIRTLIRFAFENRWRRALPQSQPLERIPPPHIRYHDLIPA
jgi:hypothetical protein